MGADAIEGGLAAAGAFVVVSRWLGVGSVGFRGGRGFVWLLDFPRFEERGLRSEIH